MCRRIIRLDQCIGRQIEIIYEDRNGSISQRRIVVRSIRDGVLHATYLTAGAQHRRERPNLGDQVVEELSRRLQWSMESREPITLQLYDPFERREVSGIVVDIDMIGQRVRLQEGDERRWIKADDILGVLS